MAKYPGNHKDNEELEAYDHEKHQAQALSYKSNDTGLVGEVGRSSALAESSLKVYKIMLLAFTILLL